MYFTELSVTTSHQRIHDDNDDEEDNQIRILHLTASYDVVYIFILILITEPCSAKWQNFVNMLKITTTKATFPYALPIALR